MLNSYKAFSIVGVDELNLERGYVSWISPIGRALLGAVEGDMVSFSTPGGQSELKIINVEYKELE